LATGSDFNITWCTNVKIAVVAPIPSASVITAVLVNPGAFRNCRIAFRKPSIYLPSVLSVKEIRINHREVSKIPLMGHLTLQYSSKSVWLPEKLTLGWIKLFKRRRRRLGHASLLSSDALAI
jgi:hypothetical protein